MKHEDAFDRLTEYADGELAPAVRAAVETHVEECAACKTELGRIQAARQALGSLRAVRAPDRFDDAVAGTIRRRSRGRFFGARDLWDRLPFMAVSLLTLLVLLAILLVAWLRPDLHHRSQAPAPPSTALPAPPSP